MNSAISVNTQAGRFAAKVELPSSLPAPTGRVGRREDGYYEVHHLTMAAYMVRCKTSPDQIRRVAAYRTTDGRFMIILSNPNPANPDLGFAVLDRIRMAYAGSEPQQVDAEVAAMKQQAVTIRQPATSPRD